MERISHQKTVEQLGVKQYFLYTTVKKMAQEREMIIVSARDILDAQDRAGIPRKHQNSHSYIRHALRRLEDNGFLKSVDGCLVEKIGRRLKIIL